ncbi:MAG: M20/M25/M40 family metallo-hydrolase [Dehalococcoidia bacterium]
MSLRQDRVALLDRYLRIATVSHQVTAAMVQQVQEFWHDQGLALVPLLPEDGSGTPALFAEIAGASNSPSLLLYGHYDVQPTGDPALWCWEGQNCAPFEPAYFHRGQPVDPKSLHDAELGEVLVVGRGGADNKGQHLANILGVLDAARSGRLKWTVKVFLDGEEEHGSPHLLPIAQRHRDMLKAKLLIGSDGPKQRNQPTLLMGVRGLLIVDIIAENGAPASLHSGNYGNLLPNPFLPLAGLIADIDRRVRDYAGEHDSFRQEAVQAFAEWENGATWKPFLWPTVNVNHLQSDGASPDLTRTIIPRSIHARLDIRLTPDTPPAAVRALIEAIVSDHASRVQGVSFNLRTGGDLPASYTSPARPEFRWLLRLLAEDGEPVALPILGGTLPNFVFTDELQMPAFWLPAANADNQQHDINEHYLLRHFFLQTSVYERIVSSRPGEN